ncbi:ring-hydroxylating dioxygenase, large terminal subunit [Actinoalloteichus sp. GBA129-24]|uniref:Ring-hydroxylating dioxygenase, large terminal subunit n=1 Tax=Actinoalloteichus fjordicus TaxID=1612552 RepID=A0AAC9PS42_9PSEU|nr:ring-hydroxylating dioxygenase, large terminal subunit [Actinoalloteichus fjordicus]APU20570.1 ring-hydroxylating dioxygenase, large terminal subunit [Actinoalloteichus sp. GBA129-24]
MSTPSTVAPEGLVADSEFARIWPGSSVSRVPYWVYTAADVYRREQERIFAGPFWNYVALAAEIPRPGDFVRTFVGGHPIIVVRAEDGAINAVLNRCAHRGLEFCMERSGNARRFVCPYHQWTYGLDGTLRGVPFRRGVGGNGGMPADFEPAEHGLRRLAVAERNGVVFASLDHAVPPLEAYLGAQMTQYFDRVFDGRELTVLGYQRHRIPANWKLIFENIKDPYHASLLHVFLVSLGLFRADQPSRVLMDATGQHAVLSSRRGEQRHTAATADIENLDTSLRLADPNMLVPAKEFAGPETVVMQTLWPNLMIQQQTNTLAMRQIVTRAAGVTELHWTYFGYADDDAEMTRRRLRQANLQGPAGLVGIDDWEVLAYNQRGLQGSDDAEAVVEMGGHGTEDTEHMVTEVAIRAFYRHYRQVMGL